MKKLAVSLILLAFAADGLAQAPAPGQPQAPVQLAQAGGASSGAVPATSTGAASTAAAIIALGVAAVAAVTAYNSTSTSSNH